MTPSLNPPESPQVESLQAQSATTVLKQLMVAVEIPSFRALCRVAGVSDWAVRQLKQARIVQMRVETLQKLAAALQLSLPELLSHFGAIADASQRIDDGDRIPALEAEYQRLQTQLKQQEALLRQSFQQEVLTVIEPWLLQWPTVAHAVAKNPNLPAAKLIPLVQPVQNLLDQWEIQVSAPVGSEVPYDPQQHQLMEGTAQPGDPVKIRYTGFVKGETLLHRAKVSPVNS